MKIVYLDAASGVSGDMLLGALVDAGVDLPAIQTAIDSLGLPGCRLTREEVQKKGFRATKVRVEYQPEHVHRHLSDIERMIEGGALTTAAKERAGRIFRRLGEAEAKVHGVSVDQVHFHEVGAADSIADIVGGAVGWDLLGPDRIVCSPIPTGQGAVRIAHGRVSVPAPATAELLRGIPLAESSVRAELTTPTGAAIVAEVADAFGPPPAMTIETIGYGAGDRDLEEQPNVLRLLAGRAWEEIERDQVWMLQTNLDDCTGELIGHCATRLMEAGALDVYTVPIQMKKNRPAVMLNVICQAAHVARLEEILFRETTTLGVRRWPANRHKLRRVAHIVETSWGPIEGKAAIGPGGAASFSPEYESCRLAAQRHHAPLRDVYDAARKAFDPATLEPPSKE